MWAMADKKYEAALKIKPDDHEAFYNWSLALAAQAETKSGKQAKRFRQLADEKLSAARTLAPELYAINDEPES